MCNECKALGHTSQTSQFCNAPKEWRPKPIVESDASASGSTAPASYVSGSSPSVAEGHTDSGSPLNTKEVGGSPSTPVEKNKEGSNQVPVNVSESPHGLPNDAASEGSTVSKNVPEVAPNLVPDDVSTESAEAVSEFASVKSHSSKRKNYSAPRNPIFRGNPRE